MTAPNRTLCSFKFKNDILEKLRILAEKSGARKLSNTQWIEEAVEREFAAWKRRGGE